MSELVTTWGYTITDAAKLAPMLTPEEYNALTAYKYSGDVRIEPTVEAASLAVRNYCGWHVYPSRACRWSGYAGLSPAVSRNGAEILIQLPAKYVTSIVSVKIGGFYVSDYILETNGLLHVINNCAPTYAPIIVEYVAGLPEALMGALRELVGHRVTHAMANSYGIASEASGGVSITYSQNWSNSARATALADDNKEVLEPYRLQGVF